MWLVDWTMFVQPRGVPQSYLRLKWQILNFFCTLGSLLWVPEKSTWWWYLLPLTGDTQNFGCFFGKKRIFGQKKHFSAKRKSGCFSVIPAGTRYVVIVGHFFAGPDGPTKIWWPRSKFKGPYTSYWALPKMAKNRGESQKMTHRSETENLGWVVPMGKL